MHGTIHCKHVPQGSKKLPRVVEVLAANAALELQGTPKDYLPRVIYLKVHGTNWTKIWWYPVSSGEKSKAWVILGSSSLSQEIAFPGHWVSFLENCKKEIGENWGYLENSTAKPQKQTNYLIQNWKKYLKGHLSKKIYIHEQ